jgi:hypothetical protein
MIVKRATKHERIDAQSLEPGDVFEIMDIEHELFECYALAGKYVYEPKEGLECVLLTSGEQQLIGPEMPVLIVKGAFVEDGAT